LVLELSQVSDKLEPAHHPQEAQAVLDQANKMIVQAKKEIILLFPVNQELIIQFTLKFQKLHSIATNKNSLVIMLMLKLNVKFSTFVL
jgi:hypothetical protein